MSREPEPLDLSDATGPLVIPAGAVASAESLARAVLQTAASMPFAAEPQQFLEALEDLAAPVLPTVQGSQP